MSDEGIDKGSTSPEPVTCLSTKKRSALPGRRWLAPMRELNRGNQALVHWHLALPGSDAKVDGVDVKSHR